MFQLVEEPKPLLSKREWKEIRLLFHHSINESYASCDPSGTLGPNDFAPYNSRATTLIFGLRILVLSFIDSISSLTPAIVGFSNSVLRGKSTSKLVRTRERSWTPSNE